jgi:hypothetical protein
MLPQNFRMLPQNFRKLPQERASLKILVLIIQNIIIVLLPNKLEMNPSNPVASYTITETRQAFLHRLENQHRMQHLP